MTENTSKPMILIDMAKNRIRIHRTALDALQNPEYILLVINPAEKSIGILPSKLGEPGAHRVKTPSVLGKNCFELYSTGLTRQLREVCRDWLSTGKYLMEGLLMPGKQAVCFSMSEAMFKGTGKAS